MKRLTLTALCVLIMTVAAYPDKPEKKKPRKESQRKEDYVEVREEVVVTATMSPKPLKLCSRSVAVLAGRDLEAFPGVSALSILEHTAGVFVQRSGEYGRADPDIRGIGQNGRRIAVLVDGRPEKMGLFGCAVSHAFPLDNVDRVEVVRGPASVLYGGEAMGGVIHIRTRLPRKGYLNHLELSGGSFASRGINMSHGGAVGATRYLVNFDHRSSDGFRPQSAYQGYSATGQFAWSLPSGGVLRLQGKFFAGDKDEPGPLEEPSPGYFTRYRRGALDAGFRHQGRRGEWELRVYRNFGHHRFSDGWHSQDHTSGGFLRFSGRLGAQHEYTAGMDLRFFGGRSLGWPQGEWHKWEGAVFVHDDWIPGAKWVVSGGLRLHNDSAFGMEIVPRLGVVFLASQRFSLRASLSRGFRSPQLNELEMFPSANPDLQPERMWNLETGIEARLGGGLTLDATVFLMRGTNLIRLVPWENGGAPFRFENIDDFLFSGVEAGLRADLAARLTLGMQYAFLYSGAWTRGRPGHKWNLDLRWTGRRFLAFFQGQFVSDYHAGDNRQLALPNYFLLNARLALRPVQGLEIRLDLLNLTDAAYLVYGEFPGVAAGTYPMPGRHFRLGAVFRF